MPYYILVERMVLILIVIIFAIHLLTIKHHRPHRILWCMLLSSLIEAVLIQAKLGRYFDHTLDIPDLRDLLRDSWGVLNLTLGIDFVRVLENSGQKKLRQKSLIPMALPVIIGMVIFFSMMPAWGKLDNLKHSIPEILYASLQAIYTIIASAYIIYKLLQYFRRASQPSLKLSVLLITIGTVMYIPFMLMRTIQRTTGSITENCTLDFSFTFIALSFFLVPAGCSITIMDKYLFTLKYFIANIAIYKPWETIRTYMPEEIFADPKSSLTKKHITFRYSYYSTISLLMEIQDTVLYLLEEIEFKDMLLQIYIKNYGVLSDETAFFQDRPIFQNIIFWKKIISEFNRQALIRLNTEPSKIMQNSHSFRQPEYNTLYLN